MTPPVFVEVPVDGGSLAVAQWGDSKRVVLGIHGISASSISLTPVARHLADAATLVAPDLRGRGASAATPGPYGMAVHAADCATVLERLAGGPAAVLGESMGAYVAVVLAASRPDLVERVVLVDGGIPATPPGDDVDVDAIVEAVLGPSLQRLSQTFASLDAYFDFWRQHPAFVGEWNSDIEAYLSYDLVGDEPTMRSRVSEAAVRADGADTLRSAALIASSLRSLTCPVTLLRAPRNLLNQPTPVLPEDLVAPWRAALPQLVDEVVDDTNHYSIVFGERGSKTIAERCRPSI